MPNDIVAMKHNLLRTKTRLFQFANRYLVSRNRNDTTRKHFGCEHFFNFTGQKMQPQEHLQFPLDCRDFATLPQPAPVTLLFPPRRVESVAAIVCVMRTTRKYTSLLGYSKRGSSSYWRKVQIAGSLTISKFTMAA